MEHEQRAEHPGAVVVDSIEIQGPAEVVVDVEDSGGELDQDTRDQSQ